MYMYVCSSEVTVNCMMALESPTSVVALNDGNKIPVLGLGTWLGGGEAVALALKNGYRLIDTATLYNNEEEVGKTVRESGIPREEIFVVTKVWDTDHGREKTTKALTDSLQRLGLDYVDLYLMHSPMGGKTVETWDTMVSLKEQGLARSIGVSNFNLHHLEQLKLARPNHIPAVNEIETHPFLWWEDSVAFCRQAGIAVIAYSPLAKASRLDNPTLVSIAEKHHKSPAQVMIRWSLQQGFICIPKSTKEHRIKENSNIFDFQLSAQDMQTLSGLDEHLITEEDWGEVPDDWPGVMVHPWEP